MKEKLSIIKENLSSPDVAQDSYAGGIVVCG